MTKQLVVTTVLVGVMSFAGGNMADAGHHRSNSGFSLGQLLQFRIVSPSNDSGYQQHSRQYNSRSDSGSHNYDPSYRFRYGYGAHRGNYYRDPQGFFSIRNDSRYWHGIHR